MDFIEKQASSHPELAEKYGRLGELFAKKTWHQLTLELLQFLRDDANVAGDNFSQLYENFIVNFDTKLNQLKLAQLIGLVGRKYPPEQAAEFFDKLIKEKEEKLGLEATLFLKLERASVLLSTRSFDDVKVILKECAPQVETLTGTQETSVHSSFYSVNTEFHKLVGPPEAFYKSAIKFLAYTPMSAMAVDKQRDLAADMALAALTGDGLYNFGEIMATPIIASLEGTPDAWLAEMLRVFSRGDVETFNTLMDQHSEQYMAQPALAIKLNFVKEKIAILALMDLIFAKPSHERTVHFTEIAAHTKLAIGQVEWLVMRSMSLKLLEGTMDQVEQTLEVTALQPRVLGTEQIGLLQGQLDQWSSKAATALNLIEDQTPELFG